MATQRSTTSTASRRPGQPCKTIDGERVRVSELNLEIPFAGANSREASGGKLRRWWRNVNLVLAGMYTGLTCYGTPHSQRAPESGQESEAQADKPDNRPI